MRRIVIGLSVVMLLLFAALWLRSYGTNDDFGYAYDDGSQIEAYTLPGRIHFVDSDMPLNPVPGWYHKSQPQWADASTDFLHGDGSVRFAGFVYARDPYNSKYHSLHILIPFWFPVALGAVLPLAGLLNLGRRTWRKAHPSKVQAENKIEFTPRSRLQRPNRRPRFDSDPDRGGLVELAAV